MGGRGSKGSATREINNRIERAFRGSKIARPKDKDALVRSVLRIEAQKAAYKAARKSGDSHDEAVLKSIKAGYAPK